MGATGVAIPVDVRGAREVEALGVRPRVLLIEDVWYYADALAAGLRQRGIDVVATARTGAEGLRLAARLRPDVALVDVDLREMDGVALCAELQATLPDVAVVIVTSSRALETGRRALAAGVRGYIVKDDDQDPVRCVRAIHGAVRGDHTIDREFHLALRRLAEHQDPAARFSLTPTECAVLPLVAEGRTNIEIAESRHVGTQTVKNHVSNILLKLDARNRMEAVARARAHGILP
jgi:DNA-binding NarL/FixJ family response regulator